jgi:hypothetical protein
VGEEVGAVRGDLEVKDGIGGEEIGDGGADLCLGGEDEEAFVAFAKAELARAAHHAVAIDAAEFADLDFEIAREDGAGERQRDFVADGVIFCAADDLDGLAIAGVHFADAEAVGIRVLGGFEDLGYYDAGDIGAAVVDFFDFDAGQGEEVD